jgi:hypothetical protein
MVLYEFEFEAFLAHKLFPFFKLLQDLKNSCPMPTEHHVRPLAELDPSTLILVGKKFLEL